MFERLRTALLGLTPTLKDSASQSGRAIPPSLSQRIRNDRLTYLCEDKIANLEACANAVNLGIVPGDFYETGIALGGSAILLASVMGDDRAFHGYDVFSQIPPPSERDEEDAHSRYTAIAKGKSNGIGEDTYYGYIPNLYDQVVRSFGRYGIEVDGDRIALHEGLFEDTLKPQGPVALAHIDCDWHDAVMLCLERIYPHLSVGGYIILDDYHDYRGCQIATDRFLTTRDDLKVVVAKPNLVVRRGLGASQPSA